MNLNELMTHSRFKDLILLNEAARPFDKKIKSIEITETPDVAYYISEDALVLTTAMFFQDKQTELIPFIDSLISAKASGLAIKTGRFLNYKITHEVINHATQKGFPIYDIPDNFQLGALTHQLTDMIQGEQHEQIGFALDLQKEFSELLLNDATTPQLINRLSQRIQTPLLLVNSFKEIIAYSDSYNELRYPPNEIIHQIDFENIRDLYKNITITGPKLDRFQVGVRKISTFKFFPSYLIIINPDKVPYPISYFAFEQADLVISFQLFKQRKIVESQATIVSSSIYDAITSSEEINDRYFKRYKKLGILNSQNYQLLSFNILDDFGYMKDSVEIREKNILLKTWLSRHIKEYFPDALYFEHSQYSNFCVLLQKDDSQLEEKLTQIQKKFTQTIDISMLVNISQLIHNIQDLKNSLMQLKFIYDDRIKHSDLSPLKYFDQMGISNLFQKLETEEKNYFSQNILKEFYQPDNEKLIELRETLKAYLENHCEITATADQLFIHRNTVKYRINNCETILGKKVNDPEYSLALRLALALSE